MTKEEHKPFSIPFLGGENMTDVERKSAHIIVHYVIVGT